MDHIRYQTFKIYFEYILKEHGQNTFNPSIETYANRTENKIMFKIKTGYYLELSTQDKITKDKNAENVTYLEMTEVLLIHAMLLRIVINKIQKSCIHLSLINCLVNYWIYHLKILHC